MYLKEEKQTNKQKKKEKKTDLARESHCGDPGGEGGARGSRGLAAGTVRTWREVWDAFRS